MLIATTAVAFDGGVEIGEDVVKEGQVGGVGELKNLVEREEVV